MARSLVRSLLFFALLALVHLAPLGAQLIPLRTVPVASGDQFLTVPAATLGMAGVTLAVDDSLADPWSNPAKGVFIAEGALLSAPTFYGISDRGGGGRTFPVAGVFRGEGWFGGVSMALQQIDNDGGRGDVVWIEPLPWGGVGERLSDRSARNVYGQAFVARRLGRGPWSLGVGLSLSGLDAMDGVDLLYTAADRIEQTGSTKDVRVGLYRDGADDRLAVLLLHNRVDMTHDVTFVDVTWDTLTRTPSLEPRLEVNQDKTHTWGVHTEWSRTLSAPGWRLGTALTVNRKSHPKIPNYEIQNIPRDPGITWAYEAGVGLSRTRDAVTFGLDVSFQPIWSETWQEADTEIAASLGDRFQPGDRTIENDFFFTNVVLRAGLARSFGAAELQAGVALRSYDYELEQHDLVERTVRTQREAWMEWTPTLGAAYHFEEVELRYSGRLTTGTGQPGLAVDGARAEALDAASDFILAPSGPLTLQDATVVTHQVAVRIPIR